MKMREGKWVLITDETQLCLLPDGVVVSCDLVTDGRFSKNYDRIRHFHKPSSSIVDDGGGCLADTLIPFHAQVFVS